MAWLGSFIRIVISSGRRSKLDLLDCYKADICFGGRGLPTKGRYHLMQQPIKMLKERKNTGHAPVY